MPICHGLKSSEAVVHVEQMQNQYDISVPLRHRLPGSTVLIFMIHLVRMPDEEIHRISSRLLDSGRFLKWKSSFHAKDSDRFSEYEYKQEENSR
jgi:hypothetical protein